MFLIFNSFIYGAYWFKTFSGLTVIFLCKFITTRLQILNPFLYVQQKYFIKIFLTRFNVLKVNFHSFRKSSEVAYIYFKYTIGIRNLIKS